MGITIGLYYNGARYLAAWLGRWTSADPVGLQAGVNLYQYCRGSPINYTDPTGTFERDVAFDMGGRNATENARLRDDAATEVVKGAWNSAAEEVSTFARGSLRSDPGEKGWYLREQEQIKNNAADELTEKAKFEGVSPTAELGGAVLLAIPGLILGGAEAASLGRAALGLLRREGDDLAAATARLAVAGAEAPSPGAGSAIASESVPSGAAGALVGDLKKRIKAGFRSWTKLDRPPKMDPAKLKKVQASMEKKEFTFKYDESFLDDADADAAYVVGEQGKPGTIYLRPNPDRAAVVEELIHANQHRAAGFPSEGIWGLTRKEREIGTQKYMLKHPTIRFTPSELHQFLGAWRVWLNQ